MIRPQPPGFTLENAFENASGALGREVIEFWLANHAVGAHEVERRVHEIVFVARSPNGAIAGVCTAYRELVRMLDNTFLSYRTFVAPAHRTSDLAIAMLQRTIAFFEERFVANVDRRAVGLFLVVENPLLIKYRNEAIWPTSRLTYVGNDSAGRPCRVRYFRGATL
jgi:hypothetical protein